jgi:hypothetical protein
MSVIRKPLKTTIDELLRTAYKNKDYRTFLKYFKSHYLRQQSLLYPEYETSCDLFTLVERLSEIEEAANETKLKEMLDEH